MDINQVSENIKTIRFPLIFLFRLVSYSDVINDNNLSIVMRLFLSYHHNTVCEVNIKRLFKRTNLPKTIKVINDFYKIVYRKYTILFNLKNFSYIYTNKKFWNLSPEKQIESLHNNMNVILAIYECSRGGLPLHFKISDMLNNMETRITIKERLNQILRMFGHKVFYRLEIPIIDCEYFEELSNEHIIKYMAAIYDKTKELLIKIIQLIETFIMLRNNMSSLFNPVITKINIVSLGNHSIDSETDTNDFK